MVYGALQEAPEVEMSQTAARMDYMGAVNPDQFDNSFGDTEER